MSNKFLFKNTPPTVGLTSFIVVNPVLSSNNATVETIINQGYSSEYLISDNVSKTPTLSTFLISQSLKSVQFESVIEDFFLNLSRQQESLGSEFISVLYDNLWDLYQS
jgi:hypothetical protein